MQNPKILLIVPAYNEEECILNTYNKIVKFNNENNTNFDVIVINDGSTDNTLSICQTNKIPFISLIHNLGIGGAVQTGYKYAYENNYDIAVQYDGDGQHDVAYVRNIISPIIKGDADVVIGSRFVDKTTSDFKSSISRRAGIKIISFFIKIVTGTTVLDTTSGFRAVNKDIIRDFASSYPTEYPEPITTTELLRKKYVVKEVAVSMNEREGGESSIKTWKTVYYMVNVILSILIIKVRRYPHVK